MTRDELKIQVATGALNVYYMNTLDTDNPPGDIWSYTSVAAPSHRTINAFYANFNPHLAVFFIPPASYLAGYAEGEFGFDKIKLVILNSNTMEDVV